MRYQKTQYSMPMLIITGFIWLSYFYQFGNNPASLTGTFAISGIMLVVFLLFFRLKITVENSVLKIIFGIGLIRFSFNISDIKKLEASSIPWYYGLGIRYTPKGTLYNVKGGDVLKIGYASGKSVKNILIGTDEPEALMKALNIEVEK